MVHKNVEHLCRLFVWLHKLNVICLHADADNEQIVSIGTGTVPVLILKWGTEGPDCKVPPLQPLHQLAFPATCHFKVPRVGFLHVWHVQSTLAAQVQDSWCMGHASPTQGARNQLGPSMSVKSYTYSISGQHVHKPRIRGPLPMCQF